MTAVFHVAIADDWETSLQLGSYEAATRGVPYEPGGHIRAVTAAGVQRVLDERYRDLDLPLLLIVLDAEALAAAGVPVERELGGADVRILGPVPCADPDVVRAVLEIGHGVAGWLAPEGLETGEGR